MCVKQKYRDYSSHSENIIFQIAKTLPRLICQESVYIMLARFCVRWRGRWRRTTHPQKHGSRTSKHEYRAVPSMALHTFISAKVTLIKRMVETREVSFGYPLMMANIIVTLWQYKCYNSQPFGIAFICVRCEQNSIKKTRISSGHLNDIAYVYFSHGNKQIIQW